MYFWIYFFLYICSISIFVWVGVIVMVIGMLNVCWKNWNCRGKENLYWNRDWNLFVRKVSMILCVVFEGDCNNVIMFLIYIRCSLFILCVDVCIVDVKVIKIYIWIKSGCFVERIIFFFEEDYVVFKEGKNV